jgi:hypothetical protein
MQFILEVRHEVFNVNIIGFSQPDGRAFAQTTTTIIDDASACRKTLDLALSRRGAPALAFRSFWRSAVCCLGPSF